MILDEIMASKRKEVADLRRTAHLAALRRAGRKRSLLDFAAHLASPPPGPDRLAVIAELKQASPSAGRIARDVDLVGRARRYAAGGAAAISVLTERSFFDGSPAYLAEIGAAVDLPLLRKDFIFDPWQVEESYLLGADAILLIVATLDDGELQTCLGAAGEFGLTALVEVHSEEELQRALVAGAGIIGVNNRDLQTFAVDLGTTERLARDIPPEVLLVGESGVRDAAAAQRLALAGCDAVLVGEALMRSENPAALCRQFAALPRAGRKAS